MRRVDRLILGEILGPWVFGVMIFTVLIMAGTFLYTFTQMLSQGVSAFLVIKLALLYLPGIMSKTFPMAMLLGTLLAFGRLSGDSEVVALRASGVSVIRIMAPIAAAGLVVSIATYLMTDYLVPSMSFNAMAMKEELTKQIDKANDKPAARALFGDDGKVIGYVFAKNYNITDKTLTSAAVVAYNKDSKIDQILEIDRLVFEGLDEWKAIGPTNLYSVKRDENGQPRNFFVATFREGAWPDQIPKPNMDPKDLIANTVSDLDVFSSGEMLKNIEDMTKDPNASKEQISNLQFGYWNKFSVPLAALVFGMVGAPLGIRNHRAGNATGFWLSVVIIFGYMLVTNAMAIMAQGGVIPAYVASFGPVVAGLIVAVELIRRKNMQ